MAAAPEAPVPAGDAGRRRAWVRPALIVLALVGAYVTLVQPIGCQQTAHFALVKALDDGTPRIDRYREETCDLAYIDGHFYAAKAPGLALASVPWYVTLSTLGSEPVNPAAGAGYPDAMLQMPRRPIWELHLWGSALPAVALVLLLRRVADRIEPGTGWAVAGAVGLGTLILPFATDYFVHVLSAALGFAAFATLFLERHGRERLPLVALAGVLIGLAVTVEFPLAVVGLVIGVYALGKGRRVLRGALFAAGGLVGVAPLAAFNLWAFGAVHRLSYENAVIEPGETGFDVVGANDPGFFGLQAPDPSVAVDLLLSSKGLFVLSPVLLLAAVGVVLLYRRGWRAESIVIGTIATLFVVYNAGYVVPFGGFVPGPRFLIPAIPFLGLALAPAIRRAPGVFLALAVASIGAMAVATAAEPMLGGFDTGSWLRRWADGNFAQSVLTFVGLGNGWLAVAPFLVSVVVGAALALSSVRVRLPGRQVVLGVGAFLAWAALLVTR